MADRSGAEISATEIKRRQSREQSSLHRIERRELEGRGLTLPVQYVQTRNLDAYKYRVLYQQATQLSKMLAETVVNAILSFVLHRLIRHALHRRNYSRTARVTQRLG